MGPGRGWRAAIASSTLQRGDAKEAGIDPKGIHMGFGTGYGPERVTRDIVAPWRLKRIAQHPSARSSAGADTR